MISSTNLRRGSYLSAVVVFLALLASFGCGGAVTSANTGGGTTTSGNSSTTATGQLVLSTSSIAFGDVAVDQSSTQTVTLSNAGTTNVTISTAGTSGPGFSISGLSLPFTLASNQVSSFSVTFSPSNAGSATGSVYFTNSGGSPVTISLSGTGFSPSSHEVSLSWTASASQVVGYYVYRGTQSGGPYAKLNSVTDSSTTFSDESVSSGQTYFYVVTAVNENNVESAYSNQATAVIPTP